MRYDFCNYATPYIKDLKTHVLSQHKDELRQTIVAAHSEAPCCTPDGEVTPSKGNIWEKYEHAPGMIGHGDFGSDFKARLRSMHETIHGYRYATKCVDLTTIDLKPEAHLRKCRSRCTTAATRSVVRKNVIPVYEFFEFYYEGKPDKFYMVMELGSESLAFVTKHNVLTEMQC